MAKTEDLDLGGWNEQVEVLRRRFQEALDAGLDTNDAHKFATSGSDIGELRRAVQKGCPPTLIARIVL